MHKSKDLSSFQTLVHILGRIITLRYEIYCKHAHVYTQTPTHTEEYLRLWSGDAPTLNNTLSLPEKVRHTLRTP